jgi:hypothetical protein
VIRSSAFPVAPGASVTTAGPAIVERLAARPTWVTGVPAASDTPGYPYKVQAVVPMLVKSMTW